jgi:acyl-CoA thioester hydrolase
MRFVLEIYKADELLVSGEMMYVHADSRIRKSEPVPQSWRDVLVAYETGCPVKL